jgi:hypothetical protein
MSEILPSRIFSQREVKNLMTPISLGGLLVLSLEDDRQIS